jgi:hypothetical protein
VQVIWIKEIIFKIFNRKYYFGIKNTCLWQYWITHSLFLLNCKYHPSHYRIHCSMIYIENDLNFFWMKLFVITHIHKKFGFNSFKVLIKCYFNYKGNNLLLANIETKLFVNMSNRFKFWYWENLNKEFKHIKCWFER